MIRLLLPLAAVSVFLALSFTTVRLFRPREPRRFFLGYGLLLIVASALIYPRLWPLTRLDEALGLAACLLLQALACVTFWNTFYSVLWGFSGSLMYDLFNEPALRTEQQLVASYQGEGGVDRIMGRRLPNLVRGGWVSLHGERMQLTPKGRVIAIGTLVAFKVFSLGMGGGIK